MQLPSTLNLVDHVREDAMNSPIIRNSRTEFEKMRTGHQQLRTREAFRTHPCFVSLRPRASPGAIPPVSEDSGFVH